jgi:hypothetical protein
LTIDVIDDEGKPVEPKEHLKKFVNQCGVVVRDNILITLQEWNEPKKAHFGYTFVDKRSKKHAWRKLMENFILPHEYNKKYADGNENPGGHERRRKVKRFALMKMGEALWTFKKN